MQLFVDETPHTFSAEPSTTIAQLLTSMRARMLGERRIVTQILWRGEPLNAENEADLQNVTVVDPGMLELVTCPAREVAVDLLGQVLRIFSPLQLQQEQIAEHLHAGQTTSAMNDLAIYIEAWQNAQSALVACGRLMGWQYEQMQFADGTVEGHFEHLAGHLRGIRDALESQDLVLLGDILTYELGDTLETWQQMLTYLSHQARTAEIPATPPAAETPSDN